MLVIVLIGLIGLTLTSWLSFGAIRCLISLMKSKTNEFRQIWMKDNNNRIHNLNVDNIWFALRVKTTNI